MKKFDLIAALLTFSIATAVSAGECPTPKPLSCERLKQLEAKRCPAETSSNVKIIDHYLPAKDCSSVPCTPVDCNAVPCLPVACSDEPEPYSDPTPKINLEYLISGGVDIEKGLNPGWNVTGAIFIPVRYGSLAVLAGEHWLKRDEFDATCRIGCKTCNTTAPAGSPWRTQINVGWKF